MIIHVTPVTPKSAFQNLLALLLLCAGALLSPLAHAQQVPAQSATSAFAQAKTSTSASVSAPSAAPAPASAATSPGDDDIVNLDIYTVRTDRDVGYRSVYSSAGSLVSEELSKLPSSISVINREFIDDIGATDIFEISRFAVGGEYVRNPINDTAFNFRGISNEWQTRNFFIWYIPTDSFSVDRIEVLRGPNALLYGDAAPGGLVNIISKRAVFRDFGKVRVQTGSWNRLRGEIDYNKRLGSQLAMRANLVNSRYRDFRDYRKADFQGAQLAVTYRPFKHTQIRAEGEIGSLQRNIGTYMFVDNFSSFNPDVSATAGTSMRTGASNYFFSYDGKTLQRYGASGYRRSNGSTLIIDQNSPYYNIAPRNWQFTGPTPYYNRDYYQYAVSVEQTILKNLVVEATYNHQDNHNKQLRADFNSLEVRRDADALLPDASSNPNYGRLFVENRFTKYRYTNNVNDFRLSASYLLDIPRIMTQRFVGVWSYRRDSYQALGWQERALADPTVQVFRRTYFNEYGTKDLSWDLISGPNGSFLPWTTASKNINKLENRAIAAIGSYWDGRITTMIGYVHHAWNVSRKAGVQDSKKLFWTGFSPVWVDDPTISDDSLNYGGVINVLKNYRGATVSLVGNYSEAFRPSGNELDIYGNGIKPVKGKGTEFGVRAELLSGKYVIAATKYNINVVNNRVAVPQAVRTEISNLFGVTTMDGNATGDTNTLNSRGFEIELTMNPVKNWTITANYTNVRLRQTDVLPACSPWYEKAVAQGLKPSDFQNLTNLVYPALTNANYVAPGRRHLVNGFTRYTIPRGWLKNFSVGGGLNYRAPAYLGIVGATYVYAPGSMVYNALLGYKTKVFNRKLDIVLNINNIGNKVTYTGYSLGAGTWDPPREFRLTASLDL